METFKRSLVKSVVYRIIHFLIHLAEFYLALFLFNVAGHLGPVIVVAFMQIICWVHYILHERLFARIKWGYKFRENEN